MRMRRKLCLVLSLLALKTKETSLEDGRDGCIALFVVVVKLWAASTLFWASGPPYCTCSQQFLWASAKLMLNCYPDYVSDCIMKEFS